MSPAKRIEDYALVGDLQTAALVGNDGSVDWLCFPRFDSPACFASLLGEDEHGHWLIAPAAGGRASSRRYVGDSLVLETTFDAPGGQVKVIDFMPPRGQAPDLVRIVEGTSGAVEMQCRFSPRFDYGSLRPWVRSVDGGLDLVGGPDGLSLRSPVYLEHDRHQVEATFRVSAGERIPFVLTWHPSHEGPPEPVDAEAALRESCGFWEEWAAKSTYDGPRPDLVMRSLLTLKALTYQPTGGIVAAPTTSLPELIGGVRNWDYRFVWLRDATFTLYALFTAGYVDEAVAWRDWLLRAVAGGPDQVQIMYGVMGERRLTEVELAGLPGYEDSAPVRIGNAATEQFQLDIYGEVMDAMHAARRAGVAYDEDAWALQQNLMEGLESRWDAPDEGIWEVRGPRRHFTHSKVLAWVAADRAVKAVERFGREGPIERWRGLRDRIHAEVCEKAFDPERNSFVQFYGSDQLDAATLMIPLVGFLPADDPRVKGTVEAISRELTDDGFVRRYDCTESIDGLPGSEGSFLACTFWLADCLALQGRKDEAQAIFDRVCGIANDVGLLSEQYDTTTGRMVGNFPQALSHVSLVNTGQNLCPGVVGPGQERPEG